LVNHIPKTKRHYRGIEEIQSRVARRALLEKGQHAEDQEAGQKDDRANDSVSFNSPDGPPESRYRVCHVLD